MNPWSGRPVVLCILDGWGHRDATGDNAVAQARTPVFDELWRRCPHAFLQTSGRDVGLPDGQFGNSEVGHMNLGAGRVVMQDLPRIDKAIEDGSLATNPVLGKAVATLRARQGRCHLMGLVSPGGVHSHQRHIVALARLLDAAGIDVLVHAFLDGRDTPPRSAASAMGAFLDEIADLQHVRLATVSGRYYAMDRDRRWERIAKALAAILDAEAPRVDDAIAAINASYARGVTDEFVEPVVVGDYDGIHDGDGLIVANFRADRVRQIVGALVDPACDDVADLRKPELSVAVGMTSYSSTLDGYLGCLFSPQTLDDLMGEVIARAGLRQLRMAESEKYPHVTFFFNGGEERRYDGEERILVPSPKVATYDLQPEMSAAELTHRLVEAIDAGGIDFVLVNFANPDMVGHTGSLPAAIVAVETVDRCLGEVVAAVERASGAVFVTADHGNCETMRDPATGGPHTAHTTNPVPCILVGGPSGSGLRDGRLADVAPTLLALLGVAQPSAMTGVSLLERDG